MEIKELKRRRAFRDKKAETCYQNFEALIAELNSRNLSHDTIRFINEKIELINTSNDDKTLRKNTRTVKHQIIKHIEKKHKIVPKNYYRSTWLALGMTTFGIPFGVGIGTSMNNMAFIGIGIPIGMMVGIAIGTAKDKQAEKKGLQLNVEMSS